VRHLVTCEQRIAKEDGSFGYRCPAEAIAPHLHKGGDIADTEGRRCLCNGLLATVGLGQVDGDFKEPPIVTARDEVAIVSRSSTPAAHTRLADVVKYLLAV